jgi:5-methylcytosine-specific restriction endonuclease McrA
MRLRLDECHIDHIASGKRGGNQDSNLRTLCRRCHALRLDPRHRGMTDRALHDGWIPPDWRNRVW